MEKYKKRPVVIEAVQWNGDNFEEVEKLVEKSNFKMYEDVFFIQDVDNKHVKIKTLEGNHRAKEGDFIIKGVQGELYPCKPGIFYETYEKVED